MPNDRRPEDEDEERAPRRSGFDDAEILREAERAQRASERQRRLALPTDYVFDKQQEAFWDLKDGTLHSEKGVDASIPQTLWRVVVEQEPDPQPAEGETRRRGRPRARRERLVKPSMDIMRVENDQFVESSTWWPGKPEIIPDVLFTKDGKIERPGARAFNAYRKPTLDPTKGVASLAAPWEWHVKKLYPAKEEHGLIFDWAAHMVQRPEQKWNGALVLCGPQGIGKDALLEPLLEIVGPWNVQGIDPDALFSDYKPWLECLLLVIHEARPTANDHQAIAFYNIMKTLAAAPPDVLALNDKYKAMRYVVNVLRPVITTNEEHAMFVPPDDRRMAVLRSPLTKRWNIEEGEPDYFRRYFEEIDKREVREGIAAWLMARDISHVDPKSPMPDSMRKREMQAAWNAPPEDLFQQALWRVQGTADKPPQVVFGSQLLNEFRMEDERLVRELADLLKAKKKLEHRARLSGYSVFHRPDQTPFRYQKGSGDKKAMFALVHETFSAGKSPDDLAHECQMLFETIAAAQIAARSAGGVTP
jgi:hypothetical protein